MKPKIRQPKSFKRMLLDLAETVGDEAREHAHKLGLRGPNLKQQVKDEIEWTERGIIKLRSSRIAEVQ